MKIGSKITNPFLHKYFTMELDIKTNINTVKKLYLSDNSLSMLLDFERVLDNVDIYTFSNWESGELVEGPSITKYFVRCRFMWPYKKMPDPKGAKRLIPYGIKVSYKTTYINIPVEIKSSDDFRPDGKKGKLMPVKIWLVEIRMPKYLMKDIKQGYRELAGEEIDLSDLEMAYENSLQDKALTQGQGQPSEQQVPPIS